MRSIRYRLASAITAACCAVSPPAAAEQQARLFRMQQAQPSLLLGANRLCFRAPGVAAQDTGTELEFGSSLSWRYGRWGLASVDTSAFRFLGAGDYGLSVLRKYALAGVRVRPVSLQAGVLLSLLNADLIGDRFSIGALWPGAAARATVTMGPLVVAAVVRTEYWWRWLGSDRYVRSIGLTVGIVQRPLRFGREPRTGRRPSSSTTVSGTRPARR